MVGFQKSHDEGAVRNGRLLCGKDGTLGWSREACVTLDGGSNPSDGDTSVSNFPLHMAGVIYRRRQGNA